MRPVERDPATPWRQQAACRGMNPEIFHPDNGLGAHRAMKVCERCIVRDDCLEYALRAPEDKGIWGGRSERERRILRRQRRMTAA